MVPNINFYYFFTIDKNIIVSNLEKTHNFLENI